MPPNFLSSSWAARHDLKASRVPRDCAAPLRPSCALVRFKRRLLNIGAVTTVLRHSLLFLSKQRTECPIASRSRHHKLTPLHHIMSPLVPPDHEVDLLEQSSSRPPPPCQTKACQARALCRKDAVALVRVQLVQHLMRRQSCRAAVRVGIARRWEENQ